MRLICPFCKAPHLAAFFEDRNRPYFDCGNCRLISVPKDFHLSLEREKAVYDLHQNDPKDIGYRRFLNKLCVPLTGFLSAGDKGLDFGCGPGPTLSVMLEEQGYQVLNYDPIYFPEDSFLGKTYHFVTATEVLEHFRQPRQAMSQLWGLVSTGGLLAVMTKQALCVERFASWQYKNDPTHIIFWRAETFDWFARQVGAELLFADSEVVILRKKMDTLFP